MPKFICTVEFDLATTVEPDGIRFDEGDTEDFEDGSYFHSDEITASGGSVTFTVEAEDEDAAYNMAEEIIYDGQEVTDYNNLTWLVENPSITTERVEEELTPALAVERVKAFINGIDNVPADVKEAFDLLLGLLMVGGLKDGDA